MYRINYFFMLVFLTLAVPKAVAQDQPFNCDDRAYLFQNNDVFRIDLASGSSFEIATNITAESINAVGYNPKDGYMWGSLKGSDGKIVRIGDDFTVNTYTISALPQANRYIGDINNDGIYYARTGTYSYHKIDLDPASPNYLTSIGVGTLSENLSIHDWAFNANDNQLYTVEKGSNKLYRINPDTGNAEDLGKVPILGSNNYTFGAVYFDVDGNFYISSNSTGTIYIINDVHLINNGDPISSNLFAFGPSSSKNDGARCSTAAVPEEICDNGIDDDGDGLIDCDDPACSGQISCPILIIDPTPVTEGITGGLESNNRLSQQISKRNFNRTKTNFRFNKEKARRITKKKSYGKKTANNTIRLDDFIPVNIINEDEAIESSPSDLVGITNATEVFSVDYLRNKQTVSTILALKTENGVYEHTKYICDRLLGAELISVSTFTINEQTFLRSIIRNIDGGTEYSLSFSAKETNNGQNFNIESHWNLDKYDNNGTYYNFQIWSNTIDELMLLTQEVLRLLEVKKTIQEYKNSPPPVMFVKSGSYKNGKLNLSLVNINGTNSVTFDAGFKRTETTEVENMSSTLTIDPKYLSNITVDTGNLFDIGFRVGDGVNTPDDLFMSDGAWGVDDAASSTSVEQFDVLLNEKNINSGEFPVERNIRLRANTSEYVSVYKPFTPKFNAIDISDYDELAFEASGTGTLELRITKNSIYDWEHQYKTSVSLTENNKEFRIPFSSFSNNSHSLPNFDDATMIIFTMVSENGQRVSKEMNVGEIKLINTSVLSIDDLNLDNATFNLSPNPMSNTANLIFNSVVKQKGSLILYNHLGQVVQERAIEIKNGQNSIAVNRDNLASGVYFVSVKSDDIKNVNVKLIIK